jgi:hypothetical protein
MTLALLAAAVGALAYGGGSVLQAVAANRAAAAGHGVLGVARQWLYVAGLACDLAGWLLSLAALRRLPLFAVQAILAGSLAVTVVLAAAVMHVRVRRADLYAICVIIAALVVLGAAADAEHSQPVGRGVKAVLLGGLPLVMAGARAAARWSTPVVTGATAGLAFGGAALCARAIPDHPALISQPLAYALLAYGATGMFAYAHALEHGDVGPITAALWVTEIVVPAALGVAVLGDHARPAWAPAAVFACAAAVGATVVLAASPVPAGPPSERAQPS